MFTITFEPYDMDTVSKIREAENIPDAPRFFRWLHEAFFFRRMDPMSGVAVPLTRIGNDPVKIDASLALLKMLRALRVENPDKSVGGFRLRPDGYSTKLHATELDLLEEIWKTYAGELLGASDADTLVFMTRMFKSVRGTDDKADK